VNRSARVAGAAKGGQIVFSEELLQEVKEKAEDFSIIDLGQFSLKVCVVFFQVEFRN
jgi:class 3 adenylate cyclase